MVNEIIKTNQSDKLGTWYDCFSNILKQDYSSVSSTIQSPSIVYFMLLNRAKFSKESGIIITQSILDSLSDFVKNDESQDKDMTSIDLFLKNIKVYNVRFNMQTIGRNYNYSKKEIQYSGIAQENKEDFVKKYIEGNYLGEIPTDEKKNIALDNILSETHFSNLNSSFVEEKMKICLQNNKYTQTDYAQEVTKLFSNIHNYSKIERILFKSFIWTFCR